MWNIANAKQQFSEVVRLSAQEPQTIYNRSTPVATLVSASEFERFQAWKTLQSAPKTLDIRAQFEQLRHAHESKPPKEKAAQERLFRFYKPTTAPKFP